MMRWTLAIALWGCGGDKGVADLPAEADADADADSDSDSDADSETATVDTGPPPRDDCPEDGAGMIIATITDAPVPVTADDSVNLIFFPSYPGPPGFFFARDGEDFAALPAPATDTGVPAQYWHTVMVCLDRGADHLASCDGPDDLLLLLPDPILVAPEMVITLDVDFTLQTTSAPAVGPPDPSCP